MTRCMTLLAPALLALAACGHAQVEDQSAPGSMKDVAQVKQEGNLTVRLYDLNHDGRPDVWEYYKKIKDPDNPKNTKLQIVRKEIDLNGDGKVDMWIWFDDKGQVSRQALDLDYDGHVDVVEHYEKGELTMKEVFHGGAAKPDEWKYYEKGQLVRVERDTHCPGRADTWEYWEGGHIDRVGKDTDCDGQVDQWIKPKGNG